MITTRREFLSVGVGAAISGLGASHDLLIRGGRLIDPAQSIDKAADVLVRNGKVAAIGQGLTAAGAATLDATGLLVVPGLIDIHVHCRDKAFPPKAYLDTGVTTIVDAGSRGAVNIGQLIDDFAVHAPNRMRVWLNIAELGNYPGGIAEFLDGIGPAKVEACRAAAEKHKQWVVGIKARLSRSISKDLDVEILKRAIAAAGKLPVMIHVGDTASPLPTLLAMLRPGDVVTHMYAPNPHGILDDVGKVLPEVIAARKRGIRFDFGNGRTEHWHWEVAEKAIAQGFVPDTISSDLEILGSTEQVFNLPTVMSKFLHMGMPLSQVIACVTHNPTVTVKPLKELGTLKHGSIADITILDIEKGSFPLVDNYKNQRVVSQKFAKRHVIVAGVRQLS